MNRLLRTFRRWWPRWSYDSQIVNAPEYRIDDDGYYRRPLMLPYSVTAGGAGAVQAYITEARAYYRGQFDDPYRSSLDAPVTMPVEVPLEEWDFATRRDVLTNCHAAYHRNPIAKRAVDLTRQFAVGKGHSVTCQNRDVQAVIDEFRQNEENNVYGYDRTFLQDLQVDGEIFIRFFDSADGQTVIVPIPPWYIVEIRTAPGFFRRVEAYHLQYPDTNVHDSAAEPQYVDEWIPAADVLHVPINNHSYELRGRPDLYPVLPWLKAYKNWLEDRARQNKWRGALLWWVKVSGASVNAVGSKAAQWSQPPTPGSAYVSTDKEEVTALSNSVGAPDVAEDGRQIRIMAAAGLGVPEYMIGDGENANLATATAQQLPALWKFTDAQELLKEQVWTAVYRRVLRNAIAAGRLSAQVRVEDQDGDPVPDSNDAEQTIDTEKAFTVEYYDLQADDPKTMAEALALDMANDLVSRETARGLRGYEHAVEMKRLAREEDERAEKMGAGQLLRPQDIGLPDEIAPADEMAAGGGAAVRDNGQQAA
jgi:hypothetical protein